MKNIIMQVLLSFGLMFGICSGAYAVELAVYNDTHGLIDIHEGVIQKHDQTLHPGQFVAWDMRYTHVVRHLSIAYQAIDGSWVRIPGCPYGTYDNSVKVHVTNYGAGYVRCSGYW